MVNLRLLLHLCIKSKTKIRKMSFLLYSVRFFRPNHYTTSSTIKSAGTITNKTLPASYNPQAAQPAYNPNQGANLPATFQTFHPSQPQYSHPQAMYHSHLPYQIPVVWPTAANRPVGPVANNVNPQVDSRRGSKQRARSVDTGPRGQLPVRFNNQQQQQQQAAPIISEYHQRHHHHHHRTHPVNVHFMPGPPVEAGKDPNAAFV